MVALGAAVALAGCASHKVATPGEAKLENEDLSAVTAELEAAAPQVQAEVAAARAAWPAILGGVKGRPTASTRAKVAAAAQRAAQVPLSSLLTEEGSAQLTGPAFSLAGQFRAFRTLGSRSWQLLDSSLEEIDHGSPAEARFARQNLPLYIESIYDAHFTLGGIGKKLLGRLQDARRDPQDQRFADPRRDRTARGHVLQGTQRALAEGAGEARLVKPFVCAGAGFLLAVLWFDLMFDVQVLRRPEGELEEGVLASIAAYYRRVTTTASPMNRLVAAVMLLTLAAIVTEIAAGQGPAWVGWVSLVLAAAPIGVAGATYGPERRTSRRTDGLAGPPERAGACDLPAAPVLLRLDPGAARRAAGGGVSDPGGKPPRDGRAPDVVARI